MSPQYRSRGKVPVPEPVVPKPRVSPFSQNPKLRTFEYNFEYHFESGPKAQLFLGVLIYLILVFLFLYFWAVQSVRISLSTFRLNRVKTRRTRPTPIIPTQ
jgi:hypothetical protein